MFWIMPKLTEAVKKYFILSTDNIYIKEAIS